MVAANVLFYTRRASTAYNTYGIGKRVVKTLPKGSAFRIREIIRYQGVVWVKSGLGHWYEFTNDLFEDASCHRGARVYLSPYTPMMQGGGTNVGSGRIYAAEIEDGDFGRWFIAWHVQPAV